MTEFTDPTIAYLFIFVVALGGAAGAGYFLAEHVVGAAIGFLILGLGGFVSGIHVADNHAEHAGFLVFSAGVAAVIAYFLPVQVIEGVAAFVIGYILGMRTKRR